LNAIELLEKANRALRSAKTLQADGDLEGACNRAYYAMFDAARAALLLVNANVPEEIAKTHNGLMRAFSLHLVKTNKLPVELGKALKQVENFRLLADYDGSVVDADDVGWSLARAEAFIAEVVSLLER
jgi:uncharacterized protein (UPF0332 family)